LKLDPSNFSRYAGVEGELKAASSDIWKEQMECFAEGADK
jgi:hypothetical protein